jgi:neutral trehalase
MPKKVETINIRPSWKEATWIAVKVLQNPKADKKAHKIAWDHLDNMCNILNKLKK